MHLLVQTKFTVQELSISGKHDLSARTLVPVWVKGRPIAPLFPADLTPRCGGFRVPPGGGEKTTASSKAISAIAITTAAVRPALRRGQQEHQEQQQGRSNCRDAGSRPAVYFLDSGLTRARRTSRSRVRPREAA